MPKKDPYTLSGGMITAELLDFACGQVQAVKKGERGDNDPPPGWIVRNLLKYGALAYVPDDHPLAGWYVCNAGGIVDRYARPELVYMRTQATQQRVIPAETVFNGGPARILRANPASRPPVRTMDRYAALVTACDTSLYANIVGSMRTQIIGAPKKIKDTVLCMLDDARQGLPVVVTEEQLAQMTQLDVSVPFNGMEIHGLRQAIYSEALRHFGGITPTEFKRERVQSSEVAASVAESVDNVYIMIDTFNEDAEAQDVPWELTYVGQGAAYETINEAPEAPEVPEAPEEGEGQDD